MRRVALRVPLRKQPAHRMPDEHRRLRKPLGGLMDVFRVVVDAVPDAPTGLVVPAQPDGANVVATLGKAGGEPVPAPWAVPGAVDEQDPGHGLEPSTALDPQHLAGERDDERRVLDELKRCRPVQAFDDRREAAVPLDA